MFFQESIHLHDVFLSLGWGLRLHRVRSVAGAAGRNRALLSSSRNGPWATLCETIPPGENISHVIRSNRAAPRRVVLNATGWDRESREVVDDE
jgi:hypothetical protein